MEYLEIGQIVNTSGLKGFVKVNPFTDNIKRFDKLKAVYICMKKELIEFNIEEVKYSKNVVLLKFKEISNIETAEKLKNCYGSFLNLFHSLQTLLNWQKIWE
jgi:16S rRNA processing protein RimM